jgi:hypothetical protein
MPPSAFNVICCSQQLIGDEVNLIGMLLDSGIPVMSRDRTEKDLIIIRGGASSFNPSVIMDVCDLFFIGEGEGLSLRVHFRVGAPRPFDLGRFAQDGREFLF